MACSRLSRPFINSLPAFKQVASTARRASVARAIIPTIKVFKRTNSQAVNMTGKKVEAPNGEQVPEKELWKYREPYMVHERDEEFKAIYDGSCHCGEVKFQLSREYPLASKLCHCTTCQKQHGMSSIMIKQRHVLTDLQPPPSNGLPSFTRATSTSTTATITLSGTIPPTRASSISFPARSAATSATARSWMRGGT